MLIKKHDAFEDTLHAQSDKVETVKKDAEVLLKQGTDYVVQIEERYAGSVVTLV